MTMSRNAGWFAASLVYLGAPAIASEEPSRLATYQALTSVEPRCERAFADELVVCGRREADEYRVPFIVYEAGDPRGESRYAERLRLQHRRTPCQEMGRMLVGCGMAGLSASTKFDGTPPRLRELAP